MQFGINLLPRKKVPFEETELARKAKLFFGSILIGYLLLVIAVFGFGLFIARSRGEVAQEAKQAETKIKGLEKQESLALTLKKRIEIASQLLTSREKAVTGQLSYEQLIRWVQGLVIPGVALGEVTVSPGQIVFSGEAENAVVLGEFLEKFSPSEREFTWLLLESLSRSTRGNYSFSFKALLLAK